MGLGAEDGGWVLVLVESPDLGVLGWVWGGTKPRMEAGFSYGCKEGRMRMLYNGMGCKESILGCT